ncbi:MAG: Eco57I restriction-modification methylase domain-containing protein [Candidatus Phocaeicola faecigallinarum]|uniref:site-specific DNA-methyltransferase (adenine-specific) n=1 Tax=Candidatus Phocaeicola faecigallinarum TaxID=2838732 RepID=A0A948T9H0_9BACT|nr:Eco57I restriction-modification methylase domain-containing protein [Candidatus Phocaeicola faecigallinarum]
MEFNKAYNRQDFVKFLQNSFLPNDYIPSEEEVLFRTQMNYSTEAVKLGTCESLDLVVYEVKHSSKNDARVSLSKEAFRMLADEAKDRALVVFVPEDSNANYRFSFIEITLDIKEDSSKVSYNYSNPRRYSYFLGEGIAYYTPNKYLNEKGRVVSKEDLLSRFSVEVLTKEFYQELSDWYAWAIKIIRFPNDLSKKVEERKKTEASNENERKNDKYNNEGTIRLITRLIFVWFLKQRHLIPDEFFDEKYIADNLIKDFNPYKIEGLMHDTGEVKYYTAILQNLFFAMLNSPITADGSKELTERHFRKLNEQGKPDRSDYDNNKLMRYESYFTNPQLFVELANKTVPFLNGGLFDCLDDKDNGIYFDGFSDNEKSVKLLNIPDFLFFIPEESVDLSVWYNDKRKKRVKVRGLINILKRYNFTVEENTPFDKEVSLDPELLGKVFENLLASFNPETQTTARKQTGSFYTPREIVQYMVDESLIAHLKRTVGEELEPQYRQLMQYSDDEVKLTSEQRKNIMQSLYNCKILDPACGSGAFPMGILQQMVHILNRIDSSNDMWKTMMRNVAIERTSEAYMTASDDERNEIINDIERSFDESINRPDYARKLYLIENCIYGVDIQPIAIQISKLRFFISLVVDQKTNTNPTDNFGIRPLPNLEAKFVAANTLVGLQKKYASLFDSEAIKAKENALKIAKHKIFGAKTVRTKRKYRQIVNDLRLEIATMLKEDGAVGNDEARELASWDMFDQNSSSPFFDPEWMFGVKDGFDIVIGNPPYLRIQGIRNDNPQFADYLVDNYKTATGKFDLYVAFIEKGYRICRKRGILNFVMPTKWTNSDYGEGVRSFCLEEKPYMRIINFSSYQVFNASTYTGIQWFIKNEHPVLDYIQLSCDINTPDKLEVFLRGINNDSYTAYTFTEFSSKPWKLTSDSMSSDIISKISVYPQLNTILNCISQGVVTVGDDIFVMKGEIIGDYFEGYSEKNSKRVCIESELMRPLLKGEDVKRYTQPKNAYFVLYPHHIIDGRTVPYTEHEMQTLFPKAYSYLLSFKTELVTKKIKYKTNPTYWYSLHRSRDIEMFKSKKILTPEISLGCNMSLDENGFYHNTKVYSMLLNDACGYTINALLGILNSKLFWFYLINTGYVLRGGFFTFKTKYIEGFPVPSLNKSNEYIVKSIDILVTRVLYSKKKNPNIDTSMEENEIDSLVYHLYGLTYDEVEIIDPKIQIKRDTY